ncbi:LD-carboxypeptidase [Synechococcales cyanobacterium C]|uniref:LD-carboxypeptidase n=1 Tax=Petrachloros mirabilis ULC683 TaxID=2781853 RepID=A0A8K2A0U2_9CYAN|nr:LD-carboxypeptidase [Petrachloros mirabilis]NCJ07693.1 LD-carboxypeptidase [Petrachloros mirabilis ULC683]
MNLPLVLPPPLAPGDHLWVILPSGALRELELFEQGVEIWRGRGYQVHLCDTYDHRWGYLAGTDAERRLALAQGLKEPTIKGILCGRGGYGSARLLEDWQWPPADLKWLIGFSDITSLLWGLLGQGISGVHGPVLTTLAQEPNWSRQRLFDCVEGRPLPPLIGKGWGQGQAMGRLIPANLTVATHLLGTPLQPDLRGCILALEDVTEAPYRIDRMLTQWRLSGILPQLGGVALGRFSQCEAPAPSFTVETVLRDRIGDLGIPVVSELPFGHHGANAALPVGVMACLDGDRGTLAIL